MDGRTVRESGIVIEGQPDHQLPVMPVVGIADPGQNPFGAVTGNGRVVLRRADTTLVACDVERLRAAFRETLEHA